MDAPGLQATETETTFLPLLFRERLFFAGLSSRSLLAAAADESQARMKPQEKAEIRDAGK